MSEINDIDPPGVAGDGDAPGERAEASDEVMLRKLAHELRTPIASIMSRAEVLRDESYGPLGDPKYRGYAEEIRDSARHALAVIMLAIENAHAASPQEPRANEPCDVAALAVECVQLMSPAALDANVALETDFTGHATQVDTEPTALRQILLNLMSNAIKFTAPGGKIMISVTDCGGRVVITVSDNGIGIAPAELERLRGAGSGQGFGYEMIHALAAGCGATLEIESTRGLGTAVTIRI